MQHLSVISAARVLVADVRENNLKSIFNREQNEVKARREIDLSELFERKNVNR